MLHEHKHEKTIFENSSLMFCKIKVHLGIFFLIDKENNIKRKEETPKSAL